MCDQTSMLIAENKLTFLSVCVQRVGVSWHHIGVVKSRFKNQLFIYLLLIFGIGTSIYLEFRQLTQPDSPIMKRHTKGVFEEIIMAVPGTVYFIDSPDSMITIEGPEKVIKGIELQLASNTLHIKSDAYTLSRCWKQLFFTDAYQVNIYIPVHHVDEYEVSGLGEFIGRITRSDDKLLIRSLGLMNVHVYHNPPIEQYVEFGLSSRLISLW